MISIRERDGETIVAWRTESLAAAGTDKAFTVVALPKIVSGAAHFVRAQ